jgi:hypothetical protein
LEDNIVKTLRIAIVIPLLSIVLFVTQPSRPTQAQAVLSTGCNFINSGVLNISIGPGSAISVVVPLSPGEIVTASATLATATVAQFSITNGAFVTVVGPTGVPGTLTYQSAGGTGAGVRNEATSNGIITFNVKCSLGQAGARFFDPNDDRLNREPGQPAAVYCRNQGDVHIYAVNVDDSKGKLALIVTKAEIDAVVNSNPAANTLIKQSGDGKYKLFYLPATKELSFITYEARTGKQYSHVWKGLCR